MKTLEAINITNKINSELIKLLSQIGEHKVLSMETNDSSVNIELLRIEDNCYIYLTVFETHIETSSNKPSRISDGSLLAIRIRELFFSPKNL